MIDCTLSYTCHSRLIAIAAGLIMALAFEGTLLAQLGGPVRPVVPGRPVIPGRQPLNPPATNPPFKNPADNVNQPVVPGRPVQPVQPGTEDEEKKKVVTEKQLFAAGDRWPIAITYFESTEGKESPVVVMLHGKDGNQLVWKNGFARRLQNAGYAVITVDLRKHGQSRPVGGGGVAAATEVRPNDYLPMVVYDLEAVKHFIYQEHQAEKLNMRKLAIIAADMSAPIAISFAANDWVKKPYNDAPTPAASTPRGQDVRALVLLSPTASLPRVIATKPLNFLRSPALGVSFLIVSGTRDAQDRGDAKRMYDQLTAIQLNKPRMYHEKYDTKFRGTDLLGKKLPVEDAMFTFLNKHVKQLPDPWRTRKSRLFN